LFYDNYLCLFEGFKQAVSLWPGTKESCLKPETCKLETKKPKRMRTSSCKIVSSLLSSGRQEDNDKKLSVVFI